MWSVIRFSCCLILRPKFGFSTFGRRRISMNAFPRVLSRLALAAGLALSAPLAWADKGGDGHADKSGKPGKVASGKPGNSNGNGNAKAPGQNAEWKSWQKSKAWKKNGGWPGAAHWNGNRAKNWKAEHRTWAQRGGYGGYVVPAAHYNERFGPSRAFVIRSEPTIYLGHPRFKQGGYTFLMVDPYPETWSPAWYRSEEVYIVNNNGYYLVNRKRPGTPIAVMVLD
jgi:hypothetical protein